MIANGPLYKSNSFEKTIVCKRLLGHYLDTWKAEKPGETGVLVNLSLGRRPCVQFGRRGASI